MSHVPFLYHISALVFLSRDHETWSGRHGLLQPQEAGMEGSGGRSLPIL